MIDLPRVERVLALLGRVRRPADVSLHRSGGRAAVAVFPAHREAGAPFESRIWDVPLDGGAAEPLTSGPGTEALPRWSPVDDRLAFAASRPVAGRMDLFVLEPGGEPRHVEGVPGSVQEIRWLPGGEGLLVLAVEEGGFGAATEGAIRLRWSDPSPDPEVFRPGQGRRRLFRVDLDGGIQEVGPEDWSVWEFDLVDGGTAVAVASEDPSESGWYHACVVVLDLTARGVRVLHRPEHQVQGPAVDPTGERAAFVEGWSSDRGLVAGDLRIVELGSGRVVPLEGAPSDLSWVAWRGPGSLWAAGWEGFGSAFGLLGSDGSARWWVRDPGVVGPTSFHARLEPTPDGGRIIAIREGLREPPEVVARPASGDEAAWTPLTAFNREVTADLEAYPEVEEVEWAGAGGLPIRGLLLVPDRGEPPYPMVIVIHGGPTWAWKRTFDPGGGLALWAAGFAVFLPNYRGSTGRGQAFTRLNLRDPAGAEFDDILLGVDHLVVRGTADPDRLGVTGASYGGYLTAWAVTTTDRFRAAVMVSGITDMLSCHLTCNHAFSEVMFGGDQRDPEALRLFIERSPIAHVARARTPTLILHGSEDRCTPLGQAEELYKALVLNGVETELVVYPREGHGFQEREHALDAARRTVAWFSRHLLGDRR